MGILIVTLFCLTALVALSSARTEMVGNVSFVARGKAALDSKVIRAGLFSAVPFLAVLAAIRPHSPDLIAQLSRTALAKTSEGATWWTSWYGGVSTPSYSAISPELMRVAGVWTVGIAAALVTVYASAVLLAGHERGRLAIVFVSFAATANVASGRTTFAVGVAFATLSLMFFLRGRIALAALLGALSWLGSPLAGLFLVIIMVCAAWNAEHRRSAFAVIALTGFTGLALELSFPVAGHMPMGKREICGVLTACIAMWFMRPHKIVGRISVLVGIAAIGFFAMGSPVGANILRLPMLFAAPAVVATSTLRARIWVPIATVFFGWTVINCVIDLQGGADPSFAEKFYTPLMAQLPPTGTAVNRIEVIDPVSHGPALYVAASMPLARGWERQVDVTRNPIFYGGVLNADTYRTWLNATATRWVAVPNTRLDYASKDEAQLVTAGLPYLHLTWSSNEWKLYEVDDPTPVATGVADVTRIGPSEVEVLASGAGEGSLKFQWSRGLTLVGTDGNTLRGTVVRDGDGIHYTVPAAGSYTLSAGN